ncbi:polyisoprenoid-binding protein YceI [Alteromonadaceae bacterium 2753L.S.0a.02]|nr:polyisoprenoid-binding protein YceI [Alteromonadaceae bacterium 2753L.S.0a.02]
MRIVVAGIFLLLMSGCVSLITPRVKTELVEIREGQYELDSDHAALLFKVDHLGLSTFVGRFEKFDATLDFDPENMSASRLEAVVDMASINVNNPEFASTIKGGDWFNIESYPQAIYRTQSVGKVDGNRVEYIGELTFLGKTNPVVIWVTFRGGAMNMLTGRYTLGFSASGEFKRSDFGLDNYIPAVGDLIELEIHAEFQRK